MLDSSYELAKGNSMLIVPVLEDHPCEDNILGFVHRWFLYTGLLMKNMILWETKTMIPIDKEMLFQCGL